MLDNFKAHERLAIELKYLGSSNKEIGERTNTPQNTIESWFSSVGKLYPAYQEYKEIMNQKRQETMEKKLTIADEEVFRHTTNMMRIVAMKMQKRKVLLVDKDGNAIAGPDGKPQYIEKEPNPDDFTESFYKMGWEIQRVMRGLPTRYEKQDIEQTNFEADLVLKELGLTGKDFEDEQFDSTVKKLTEYFIKQG